jgi:hypothetical protein
MIRRISDASSADIAAAVAAGEPVVFSGAIAHWPARAWTPATLRQLFGHVHTTARCHARTRECVRETECTYVDVSLAQFLDWAEGHVDGASDGIGALPRHLNWGYVDYKVCAALCR